MQEGGISCRIQVSPMFQKNMFKGNLSIEHTLISTVAKHPEMKYNLYQEVFHLVLTQHNRLIEVLLSQKISIKYQGFNKFIGVLNTLNKFSLPHKETFQFNISLRDNLVFKKNIYIYFFVFLQKIRNYTDIIKIKMWQRRC